MTDTQQEKNPHEPITDHESKKVMLRAERGDGVSITGDDADSCARTLVSRRTNPYFGPKLVLYDKSRDQEWMLTAPGPESQLQLWSPVEGGGGGRVGWEKHSEVTARVSAGGQYDICACGEALKTLEHQRKAAMKVGEHEW